MKPKIEVVFPDIKSAGMLNAEVEKIKISRHRRRMELLLNVNASERALEQFEEELRSRYHLNGIKVTEQEGVESDFPEAPVMYLTKKSSQKAGSDKETLGRAKVTEVIYGSLFAPSLSAYSL